jgi:hypothetical protein
MLTWRPRGQLLGTAQHSTSRVIKQCCERKTRPERYTLYAIQHTLTVAFELCFTSMSRVMHSHAFKCILRLVRPVLSHAYAQRYCATVHLTR